jgi:hypothetical protein
MGPRADRNLVWLLAVALAGCGAESVSGVNVPAAPTPLSNIRISGLSGSATAAPASGQTAVPPTAGPTQRVTVGIISYATPTPSPTPELDIRDTLSDPRFNPPQPTMRPIIPIIPTPMTFAPTPDRSYHAPPRPAPPPAITPTATLVQLGVGQSTAINLPAGTSTCDTSQLFDINYPGGGSTVTIDAQIDGLTPSNSGAAGFNVWDSTHVAPAAPAGTATTLTNQKNSVPGSIELIYSSGVAGRVTIELYNWTQTPLSGSLTVIGLPSNGARVQVETRKADGSC